MNDRILRIYTDGGCSGNQNDKNLGGWGAVLEFGSAMKELYGSERNTTNNRMEMTALLEAFRAITKENQRILVFSDSSYLMDCFRKKWYVKWQQNNWLNYKKEPVANREIWEELLPYLGRHDITFCRVKGHVDLDSPKTNAEKLYSTFLEWNGSQFSYDDFVHVVDMNNRADELANKGIDELR